MITVPSKPTAGVNKQSVLFLSVKGLLRSAAFLQTVFVFFLVFIVAVEDLVVDVAAVVVPVRVGADRGVVVRDAALDDGDVAPR